MKFYVAPEVDYVELEVERGFAGSINPPEDLPEWPF